MSMQEKLSEEESAKIRKKVQIFVWSMTGVAAAILVGMIAMGDMKTILLQIVLGVYIVTYTVLVEVLEPYWLKQLEEMDFFQKEAYIKIVVLAAVGMTALLYFVITMGQEDSNILYPILIYVVTGNFKRRFRDDFLGKTDEEVVEEERDKEV